MIDPKLSGTVINAETNKPIPKFTVIIGPRRYEFPGTDESDLPIHWQGHLLREHMNGKFDWDPRRLYDAFHVRIDAPGYVPFVSRQFNRADLKPPFEVQLDVKLQPDRGLNGTVLTPAGQPALKAQVALGDVSRELRLQDGKLVASESHKGWTAPIVETDAQGRFRQHADDGPWTMIAVHESGYAEVTSKQFDPQQPIRLQAWGIVEGQLLWGGEKPGSNEPIALITTRPANSQPIGPLQLFLETETDDAGRFRFDRLPPGSVQISRCPKREIEKDGQTASQYGSMLPIIHSTIQPGQTANVVLGGRGRPVVGNVLLDPSIAAQRNDVTITVNVSLKMPSVSGSQDSVQKEFRRYSEFNQSEPGKHYRCENVAVAADGSFRIESLPAARYMLHVSVVPKDKPMARAIGFLAHRFEVESMPGGESREPLQLGELAIRVAPK